MNKTYQYQCEDCKNIEESKDVVYGSQLCKCGSSWMYLVKHDKYDEHESKCRKCKSFASRECFDYKWFIPAQGKYS